MSLVNRLLDRLAHLPPAENHDIVVTRDLQVPMPDGVVLLADHYAPRSGPRRPHTDFFVRLCVVEPSGKSLNLCDGILRLVPGGQAPAADGILRIQVELWPTAYRFSPGQRIRVQVSSGAHPRFIRNLGSGEPPATAMKLTIADQAVYHDPAHPSSILLPVTST